MVFLAPVYAAQDFKCTVKEIYDISEEGKFVVTENSLISRSEFSVDRATGRIIGGGALSNSLVAAPQVTKQGGTENSYIAVTNNPSGNPTVLIIEEYRGEKMPFFYLASIEYATGVCVHY